MATPDRQPKENRRSSRDPFPETRWTLVLRAADRAGSSDRDDDWRALLETYRFAIRSVLRRYVPASQVDTIAEEFFGYVFERDVLRKVDPALGTFRQYIQVVVRRFAADRRRWIGRGATGEVDPLAVDRVDPLAAADAVADRDFQAWIVGVVQEALRRLASRAPREAEALARAYGLPMPGELEGQASWSGERLAAHLAMTEGGVRNLLVRARRNLEQRVIAVILEGVDSPDELAAELSLTAVGLRRVAPAMELDLEGCA